MDFLLLRNRAEPWTKDYGLFLLRGLPVFLKMQMGNLVFPGDNKKAERFTIFFRMLAVMHIVSMNHTAQVAASFLWSPLKALVYNDIVKYQVENPVTDDANCHREQIRTLVHRSGYNKKNYGRYAEDYGKPVILLQRMVVHGMVRFVPYPQKAVHNILVGEPRDKLPRQKSGNCDRGTNHYCYKIHNVQKNIIHPEPSESTFPAC